MAAEDDRLARIQHLAARRAALRVLLEADRAIVAAWPVLGSYAIPLGQSTDSMRKGGPLD